MSETMTLQPVLSGDSLSGYISTVGQYPMLTAEEEHQLAEDFRQNNDLEAARKLVMSHLRFVVRIARGYSGYGLAQSDLIQEGNIGLMKAVKRFDPDMGVRLVSFAVHWIRAEMHEFIIRNWRIVKVATTKSQRKLFFNLRSSKKRLGWMNHQEVKDIANDLGVEAKTVLEMEQRLSANDASFDLSSEGNEDNPTAPVQYLQDLRFEPSVTVENNQFEDQQQQKLSCALETLDDRSKDIVEKRWLNDKKSTLTDLAAVYQVSAERIRQLEKAAFAKLKLAMSE